MLSRLIYLSDSNKLITWALVKDILTVAQENNSKIDVTGLLISHGMHFLQALEGEREVIEELFAGISKDIRHENIRLLDCSGVSERLFADWSMKGFDFEKLDKSQKGEILKKYCEGENGFCIPTNPDHCLGIIKDLGFLH